METKENRIFRGMIIVIIRFMSAYYVLGAGGVTQVVILKLTQPGEVGAITVSTL